MTAVYYAMELRRTGRDVVNLFFTAVLPAFLYVIFGASQDYSTDMLPTGRGNVAMYIMVSMAAYGAVTATTGIGGMAAVERMQGWGRQLGLTPMRDSRYVLVKAQLGLTIALIPVALIYVIGFATGAAGELRAWLLSGVLVLAGAALFSLYGLVFGLAFRTEGAVSAASGSLVILAFLGNLFFPLSGTMLTIAKLTPLYGIVALAREPLTEGWLVATDGAAPVHDPLWVPVANVAVWLTILTVLAVLLVRRGRARQ
ncbi:MAG TPA: ABC transporter permease [Actinotalea caeni]|uniref:ABC transporter permease n=1 Tax=Actinotalea caeni TaxID=1348467 RepID=UPI002B4AD67A|nr:ABC transporter permease [Actinotalea caeni]HLV55520.1 ABC transporter permease [Actinotalea caeni]